jgi:hypothetical protein
VLVRVAACSLNFRDLGIVRGTYRMPVRDNIVPLSAASGQAATPPSVVRKYRGKVAGLDMSRLRAMVEESRGHLFTAAGYHPVIFAELLPKLS